MATESKGTQTDLLKRIFLEAQSYRNFEDIEKLIEKSGDLSMVPVQPLYLSIRSTESDQLALILPKMSPSQRQTMVDLDFWKRDVVDVEGMSTWLEAYSKCEEEEIVSEFARSEDFLLYIKSRLNIYTFDVEDPEYPDHDYYFLTDDSLLLIEYDENFPYAKEVQFLIRNIYSELGVEKGYAHVFKLISDSFSNLQEDCYQSKKERLREFGFVDYFEAAQSLHPFVSLGQVNSYIRKKEKLTANLDTISKNQSLHSSMLIPFQTGLEKLSNEALKISDEKRQSYLQFNFIRLINSTMATTDGLKKGSVELNRLSKTTLKLLELGVSYIEEKMKEENLFEGDNLLDRFDFIEIYKVANSLIQTGKKQLKASVKNTPFDQEEFEYFLGSFWNSFLEDSFLDVPKVKTFGARLNSQEVDTFEKFSYWQNEIELFEKTVPFASKFFLTLDQLKKDSKLNDDFYLNYQVDNIDFEAVIISSFINHVLGNFGQSDVNKMGLTISELKKFVEIFCLKKADEFYLKDFDSEEVKISIQKFLDSFGFNSISRFETYLYGIMSEHLNGYNFDELTDEDYAHIGGPILLHYTLN